MDHVSNMVVIIKNGYMAKKVSVSVPFSNFKLEIAKLLEKEGFVGQVTNEGKIIKIDLVYIDQKPRMTEIKRVSKPGLRVYTKSKNIKKVKGGIGLTLVSTPQGVMTGKSAREKKLGGEIICQVW
ncbi:30S ribosomal protein S8 [Candidatus Curtissbacteria bacterium]|nr:30S ribosomal protein S8 [Candidatus Curtissbacteria bacterium]